MKRVELYQKVRRAVLIDGMSRRAAARYFGINRKTVDKMLCFPEPAAHGRSGQTYSRKLSGFTDIIDQILVDDRKVHIKQRHTAAKRQFDVGQQRQPKSQSNHQRALYQNGRAGHLRRLFHLYLFLRKRALAPPSL